MMKGKESANPELTRVSSKGQLVIPRGIRESMGIREGDTMAVAKSDGLIVLKKIRSPLLREDFEMLKEISKAWDEIEKGRCRRMKKKEFLEEIRKW